MTQGEFFPELDSPLAKACDAFLDARDALERAKVEREEKLSVLIEELTKSNRTSVKHNGRLFALREIEAKLTVTIKEP